MGRNGGSDEAALDGRGEAVDLLSDDAPGVSVAQVARRYAMNANLIYKWLRDPRFAPDPEIVEEPVVRRLFSSGRDRRPARPKTRHRRLMPSPRKGAIEIDIAGGHRLRIVGGYDPEALARLIRGLSA